jgi:hypothetical protein
MTSAGNTFTSIGARRCEGEPDCSRYGQLSRYSQIRQRRFDQSAIPKRPVLPSALRQARHAVEGHRWFRPMSSHVLTGANGLGVVRRYRPTPDGIPTSAGLGRDSERHELASVIIGSVGVRIPPPGSFRIHPPFGRLILGLGQQEPDLQALLIGEPRHRADRSPEDLPLVLWIALAQHRSEISVLLQRPDRRQGPDGPARSLCGRSWSRIYRFSCWRSTRTSLTSSGRSRATLRNCAC